MDEPVLERIVDFGAPFDLARSLRPWAAGLYDPCGRVQQDRVVRATRTVDGPATIAVEAQGADDVVRVRAWGPGAASLIARAEVLLGCDDRPETFVPHHPIVAKIWADHPGLRLTRAPSLFETLVMTVLEQRVTTREAMRSWTKLVRRFAEPAPGPWSLLLPPPAHELARMPYYAYHPLGVEARRAETIRNLALRVRRVEPLRDAPLAEARAKLASLPGIGPWTIELAAGNVLGDPDALPIGDYHLPNEVAWLLEREPRANDARMVALLEPFRGHRYRVVQLVHLSGNTAPRYGPRRSGGLPP